MLTKIETPRYSIYGRSLGGFYTSFHVPQLKALFDVGTALRSGCAAQNLFLSHAHADHIGSLPALLGMRGLTGLKKPIRVFMPEQIADGLPLALNAFGGLHRWPLEVDAVPMSPGDEYQLKGNLWVRAIKTLHPVPSLGYVFFRRIQKLRPEFASLPGAEIATRRRRGDDLFNARNQYEFAYVTDTLPEVLDRNPELLDVDTLVIECTFLNEKKSLRDARAGCHIHLDELLPIMPRMNNQHVVLMHFSQLYNPADVHRIFDERCPPEYRDRFHLFAPENGGWWD